MRDIIILTVILGIILFLIIWGLLENSRLKKVNHRLFSNRFGKFQNQEKTEEEFLVLKKVVSEKKDDHSFFIDDITTDDLHLHALFNKMNTCITNAGEERLYHRLRTTSLVKENPSVYDDSLLKIASEKDARIALQLELGRMFKMKGLSVQVIEELKSQKKLSLFPHILLYILYALTVFCLIRFTGWGVLLLIASIFFAVFSYYLAKGQTLLYLEAMKMVLRLLKTSKRLVTGDALNQIGMQQTKQEINNLLPSLRSISSSVAFVVASENSVGNASGLVRDYFNMLFHMDLFAYAFITYKMGQHLENIIKLWEVVGELDARISISSFKEALPYVCEPTFDENEAFHLERGYHVLLQKSVANDCDLSENILLTGSNASGKSTYLRMCAMNIIMGQNFHFCFAKRANLHPCLVYSAMAVSDNIRRGESYYMAEIRALHRILEAQNHSALPVFCVVDEILRGTNTIERIAASCEILMEIKKNGVLCIAATHDHELTSLLSSYYRNMHFEEEMTEDIAFSYKIKEGPATTRNAISLLEKTGFGENLTKNALKRAENFEKTGEWT